MCTCMCVCIEYMYVLSISVYTCIMCHVLSISMYTKYNHLLVSSYNHVLSQVTLPCALKHHGASRLSSLLGAYYAKERQPVSDHLILMGRARPVSLFVCLNIWKSTKYPVSFSRPSFASYQERTMGAPPIARDKL